MIRLQNNTWNKVVYTALEKEASHQSSTYDYNLLLTNSQSFLTYSVNLVNISTTDRYDMSNVWLGDLLTADWDISVATTITASQIKIVCGDINIDTRFPLARLTNNGTLIHFAGEITGDFINNGTYLHNDTALNTFFDGTRSYFFNLPYGYYDYNIYDRGENELERGCLLIGPLSWTQSTTTYTDNSDIKVVYEP
jgi:hypothetical protein